MNSARKAAVQLAALGKRDRSWILKRLESSEREIIEPLLNELAGLPSAALIGELQKSRVATPQPNSARRSDLSDLARLRHASAKEVVPLIVALPSATIALLLQVERWRWFDDVLKNLDEDRRGLVKGLVANNELNQNKVLAEWLIGRLASKIRSERAHVSASAKKFDVFADLAD